MSAARDLLEPGEIDSAAVGRRICEILNRVGLTAECAPNCESSPALRGAIDGLGLALTDVRCQKCLFPIVTRILSLAGRDLQIQFICGFLEPMLREPFNLKDAGFREYMKWYLGLRNIQDARWAVEEVYEDEEFYGEVRLKRDIQRIRRTRNKVPSAFSSPVLSLRV
ncbi:MAG: hypothetical protein QM813_27435 [Verrucomicrobiota bacterium]